MAERPEDVFTPASPVRDDMFATRRHERLEERVQGALHELGRQIITYGPTGVGKTSLVRYLCRKNSIKYVRVECGALFDEMLRDALAQVVTEEVIERVKSKAGEAEAGFLTGIFNAKVKGQVGEDVKVAEVRRALPIVVAEALEAADVEVLFLDNYENLRHQGHAAETKQAIVQFLKTLADRAADTDDAVKVVIAGIPEASEELVTADEATARRLSQIEVTRMPPDELDEILRSGEQKLGIEFEGLCRDLILQSSDGFPYYTHLIALHCSRRAVNASRQFVELSDFDESIEDIILDCDLALRSAYRNAVETSGDVRARRSIMEAMARLNNLEVPFRDIRASFMEVHPGRYASPSELNFLSPPMSELRDKYDILADKNLPKSKNNLYRFKNPLMRAYVRLTMLRENKEQLGLS
jgi:SpoVK/Ycf46/Vps4 family AAA+-type ATPase